MAAALFALLILRRFRRQTAAKVFESLLMFEGNPVVSEKGTVTDSYTVVLTQAPD